MYIKFDKRDSGKKFSFFPREVEIDGNKVSHTDKVVFATLSESIKTGEDNGQPVWTNDYWSAGFCGKAYEKALLLKDKDRIIATEFNLRNIYNKDTKKNYPSISIFDFDVATSNEIPDIDECLSQEAEEIFK